MMAWILRDDALRGWPVWLLLIGINAAVVAGLVISFAVYHETPVSASALTLAMWLGAAVYLAFGRVRTRCSHLQLALPLSARRLWIIHALAVTLAGSMLAVVAVAMLLLQARALGEHVRLAVHPAGLVPHLVAGVALAAVLLQAPRPRLARIPVTAGYVLWVNVVVTGVQVLLVVLSPLGPAWALLPLLLAAAVGFAILRTLPGSFSLVPFEPRPSRAVAASGTEHAGEPPAATGSVGEVDRGGVPSRWIVARAVVSGVSAGAKEWVGYPAVLLLAVVMGGILGLGTADANDIRYLYTPVAAFMLFSLVGPRLGRLQHIDSLPISRRVLFAVLVVPYFLTFCAGYGLGALGAAAAAQRAEFVDCPNVDGSSRVVVPMSARAIAWSGQPPLVVSPWGESHVPTATPLWRGSRAAIYSPYSTPQGSSRAFVAWQLSRAVEAVYGARIPAHELANRYLVNRGDGAVVTKRPGLSLRKDFPGLSPGGGGPMFPALTVLVCVPWLFFIALLLRTYRACMAGWARQALVWGPIVAALAVPVAVVAGVMTNVLQPWLFRAAVEIPVQRLGESLPVMAGAWGLCGVLLLAGYLLAQRQFMRMEIPARATKYTLIDWLREES